MIRPNVARVCSEITAKKRGLNRTGGERVGVRTRGDSPTFGAGTREIPGTSGRRNRGRVNHDRDV